MKFRQAVLQSSILLLCLGVSEASMASLLDLFFGSGPVLKQKMTIGPQVTQLQSDFRIRESCTYELELWLVHKRASIREFDALLVNRELPLKVAVDTYRLENGKSKHLARLEKRPALSGFAKGLTTFSVDRMRLDKGSYRMKFETLEKPGKLEGVEAELVLQIRPKTSC